MKHTLTFLSLILFSISLQAQNNDVIKLNPPSTDKGHSIMKSLWVRSSTRAYSPEELTLQDLSDLVWAARGINRPESKKLTSPTAQNSQDVILYVCRPEGTYLYNAAGHCLTQVTKTDLRPFMEGERSTKAHTILLLIADISTYRGYAPDSPNNKHYYEMGAIDCGIVSQNIALFCAGMELGTVPRAQMNKAAIKQELKLTDTQYLWLNHPVGYLKEK